MTDAHLTQARRDRGLATMDVEAPARPMVPVSATLGEGLTPVRMEPPAPTTGLEPYRITTGLDALSKESLRRPIGFGDIVVFDDGTENARLHMARKRATEFGLL